MKHKDQQCRNVGLGCWAEVVPLGWEDFRQSGRAEGLINNGLFNNFIPVWTATVCWPVFKHKFWTPNHHLLRSNAKENCTFVIQLQRKTRPAINCSGDFSPWCLVPCETASGSECLDLFEKQILSNWSCGWEKITLPVTMCLKQFSVKPGKKPFVEGFWSDVSQTIWVNYDPEMLWPTGLNALCIFLFKPWIAIA